MICCLAVDAAAAKQKVEADAAAAKQKAEADAAAAKHRALIEAKYPVGTLEYKYSCVFDKFATVCCDGLTGLTQEAFMKAIGRYSDWWWYW